MVYRRHVQRWETMLWLVPIVGSLVVETRAISSMRKEGAQKSATPGGAVLGIWEDAAVRLRECERKKSHHVVQKRSN